MPDKTCTPTITELETLLQGDDDPEIIINEDGSMRAIPSAFRKELESLINRHSMENGCNTPDFILARFLLDCLAAFESGVRSREKWYGVQSKC
jgi:hypothetical protein